MSVSPVNEIVHRAISSASTLKSALEIFVENTAHGNRSARYSIVHVGFETRITRKSCKTLAPSTKVYTDLDFFIDLSHIIQYFAGKKWKPKRIAFQMGAPFGGMMSVYFPSTSIFANRSCSWVELPRSLLALHPRPSSLVIGENVGSPTAHADFIYALIHTLRDHLAEGYPDLEFAAAAMRTSVRTLQRHLARIGMTYSRMVEHVRFELAAEMLRRPNLKIIDIAYSLGYQDPSHFSRAFRRIAGQTPRDFRRAHMPKATSL